ncbi:dihydroorotase [Halanaerobacter jeridensis]|uniref:Dihydroorotase n=1 Tax=Halanaerobacter jeridensis TaxID=706427 RepID=A0A939BMC0_9FIRM|nr:dihydroorotase [Halanaerobacter jeridensis]MBM7556040.1 dihydroorotase [Halanaerobacter jeridensis]
MSKLLLKGAEVVNPGNNEIKQQDILIEDEEIAKIASNIKVEDVKKMDLSNKLIVPGLIDMHVHLREPGFEHKETIATGTQAAAKGGFTSVACMPNTNPVLDKETLIEGLNQKIAEDAVVNVYPIGAITKGSQGKELAEIGSMSQAGIVAVSDDGNAVMNSEIMRLALKYAGDFDLPVISHCEDENLSGDGVVHEGYYSTVTGLDPIPASSEEVMVARDIALARETNNPVHIAHISTKGAVQLVRDAKKQGIPVTCEATPHHFSLTDQAITSFSTATKVHPPLRSKEDVQAIKEGLEDGTIDVIATDHAPHATEEKDVEYDYAPFGISGLETAIALINTELVETGVLSWPQAVEKLTTNPASILGLDEGKLKEGAVANLSVIDPDYKWEVKPKDFVSKGKNTPFADEELKGQNIMTVVNGEIVYNNK